MVKFVGQREANRKGVVRGGDLIEVCSLNVLSSSVHAEYIPAGHGEGKFLVEEGFSEAKSRKIALLDIALGG